MFKNAQLASEGYRLTKRVKIPILRVPLAMYTIIADMSVVVCCFLCHILPQVKPITDSHYCWGHTEKSPKGSEHALEDGILEERTPDSQAELWVLEGKSEVHGRQILFETRFHEFRRG